MGNIFQSPQEVYMKQAATLIIGILSPLLAIAASPKLPSPESVKVAENTEQEIITNPNMTAEVLYKLLSAEMAINRDQPEIALRNYIDVAQETQDIKVAQRATQIALSIASLEEAYIPGKIWADQDKENLEAQITFSAIVLRMNKVEEAVPYVIQIMSVDPLDGDRHIVTLFKQLPEENERQNVVKVLKLVQPKVKHNLALVALADIALYENRIKEAVDFAHQAYKINPTDPKASILYTQALFQNEEPAKATAFVEEQLKKIPQSMHLRQYYTQFLIDHNQSQKAKEQMQVLSKLTDLTSKQRLQLARVCMQAGWLDLGEAFLQEVRKDKDEMDTANYFLARLYESKNEPFEAAKWYKEVKQGPFHVIAHIRGATLLMDHKKYKEALLVIDNADPQNYADLKRLLLARIDIYTHNQQYQAAFDILTEALQSEPEDMDYLYSRAVVADKLHKIDIVEQDLKLILKYDPNHIDALNALGFILANRTERYEEAYTLIVKALHLSPNNPSILDSLGWVQYKMGKSKEAVATLRKALSMYPDPEIAAHLGEVLWSINQHEEASKVWKDALQSSPDNENLRKTMERLIGDNGNNGHH